MMIKGCPKIACPNCKAILLKAVGKDNKNQTKVELLKDDKEIASEDIDGEYLIRCHKCGEYVVIKNKKTTVSIPVVNYKNRDTSTHL